MFLVTLLLCAVSFSNITVYGAEQACRDITIDGSSISYFDYNKNKVTFFNKVKQKAYDESAYNDTGSLSIFGFRDQDEPILDFIDQTNLESESKTCINAMLNATQDFEKLLNGRDQNLLKYYNLVLLSDFISSICDPEKQTDDNLVRHSLHILLQNVKKLRDVVYKRPYYSSLMHTITRTVFFRQIVFIFIVNIFLPTIFFTKAQKCISGGIVLYGMYVLYNLKCSWLPLYFAHRKYTAEYDRLTSTWIPLSADVLENEHEKISSFIQVLTSMD